MSSPIIFLHKGNSYYLKYSLKLAVDKNPNTNVYLLGDNENRHYSKLGVIHYAYDDYLQSEEVQRFKEVYKFIRGNEFKVRPDIVKFNFLKWFALYNFVISNNIESFWTFDGDVMILDDLEYHIYKFKDYDYSFQAHNHTMQGIINSQNALYDYLVTINEKFSDEEYLSLNQREFETENPGFALTMMRLFNELYKKDIYKTIRIRTTINNETFDECLFYDPEDEFEKTTYRNQDKLIKKLFFGDNGHIYVKDKTTGNLIRVFAINLSWVTHDVFYRVYKHSSNRKKQKIKEFNYDDIPIKFILKKNIKRFIGK